MILVRNLVLEGALKDKYDLNHKKASYKRKIQRIWKDGM